MVTVHAEFWYLLSGLKCWRLRVGLGVRAGVDLFVDGEVHGVVVAGAADGHAAVRICDGERIARREREVYRRVALVLVAEQPVHRILVKVEAGKHPAAAGREPEDVVRYGPHKREQHQQKITPLPTERRYAGRCGSRSRDWSIAHSISTTAPAATSSSGHQCPYQAQKRW